MSEQEREQSEQSTEEREETLQDLDVSVEESEDVKGGSIDGSTTTTIPY